MSFYVVSQTDKIHKKFHGQSKVSKWQNMRKRLVYESIYTSK